MVRSQGGRDAGLHVGTSGWVYGHWKGAFYPEDLPQHARLAYYASFFDSVEVNNTYYRLPSQHALQVWRETVGEEFTFAVKAHRYITHRKRLSGVEDSLDLFFESLEPLKDRVGIVLFQLPPFFGFDPERLDSFLGMLPHGEWPFAMEFRNATWHNEQTWELLRAHDVAFVIHDFEMAPEFEVTSGDVYVRLHGPEVPYAGLYSEEAMRAWAHRIRGWRGEGRRVWVYFNNDQAAFATRNARQLREMLASPGHGSAREREAATS